MFGSRTKSFGERVPADCKGMPTLRLFHQNMGGISGIYREFVMGAIREQGHPGAILLVQQADHIHMFQLNAAIGVAEYVGKMDADLRRQFESVDEGGKLFVRNVGYERLDKNQVAKATFSRPVWVAHGLDQSRNYAAMVPLDARMLHRSLFDSIRIDPSARFAGWVPDMFDEDDVVEGERL